MSNRVYMSAYQFGSIDGLDKIMSLLTEVFIGRRSDAESTFYASVLQAGVEQFLVPKSMEEKLPNNDFIKQRSKIIGSDIDSTTDYKLVHEMFSKYMPKHYHSDTKYIEVLNLEALLRDLCAGLRHNVAVMFPSAIPEPESLRGVLPPELLIPVSELLSSIGQLPAAGPLPRYEVQKADLTAYQEIIRSGLFHNLSESHIPLSDQDTVSETALRHVREAAARIQAEYTSQLRLSRFGVALLSLVPKLIDETVGSLPGSFANHFANLAQPFIENRRRLVLYNSWEVNAAILDSTVMHIAMNRDDEDVVKERYQRFRRQNPDLYREEGPN